MPRQGNGRWARSFPRGGAKRALAALALAPRLLLAGCARDVLDPAGDIALQQRNLIYTSTGLMLLIIVPVIVLIVVFAWRYRSGNREATYDPNFDHSTSLELAIWAGPLLIIIALGALTWSSTHLLDPFRPLDRIAPGKPTQNAYVERFNRTHRMELLDCYVFESLQEVRLMTEDWLHRYNHHRPHESLGRIPPVAFRVKCFHNLHF